MFRAAGTGSVSRLTTSTRSSRSTGCSRRSASWLAGEQPEMREEIELLSRRSFLHAAAGAGAAALSLDGVKAEFARSLAEIGAAPDSGKVDDGYWRKIREQFLLEEGFAY